MRLDKWQIEVVDDKVAEILRKKTGQERLKNGLGLMDVFLSENRGASAGHSS